jgi:HK97 family phage prohead protease
MDTLQGFEVVRAAPTAAPEIRASDDTADAGATMEVRFSAFGNWYEIDSYFEGRFLESVERGAFAKTIKESRDRVRVMFDHGYDPQIGNKSLGTIADLREDKDAAVGVVDLFDTSYNRDLIPGLRAGAYGSSMRMVVTRDEWNDAPERSEHNPQGIPERTIKEVRLMEFGPVAWPANPDATSGLRSATDAYYERLRNLDPQRFDEVTRARPQTAPHPTPAPDDTTRAGDGAAEQEPPAPAAGHPGGLTPAQRREAILQAQKGARP